MRFERREARRKELYQWLVLLGALSLTGVLLTGLNLAGVQLCLVRRVTGVPCFLCGATRAAVRLLHGRITEAFVIQPLATLLMIAGVVAVLLYSAMLFIRREVVSVTLSRREKIVACSLFTILVLVNWLYLLMRL